VTVRTGKSRRQYVGGIGCRSRSRSRFPCGTWAFGIMKDYPGAGFGESRGGRCRQRRTGAADRRSDGRFGWRKRGRGRKNGFRSRSVRRFPCGRRDCGIMTEYLMVTFRENQGEAGGQKRVFIP
jgi:hypothetical protein